jgi:hypothetical protein
MLFLDLDIVLRVCYLLRFSAGASLPLAVSIHVGAVFFTPMRAGPAPSQLLDLSACTPFLPSVSIFI